MLIVFNLLFRAGLGLSALLGSLLVVTGCGPAGSSELGPGRFIEASGEPFTAGPVDAFREPGVYREFVADHGVYLVSNGEHLVALAADSPTGDEPVVYDEVSGLFRCRAAGSMFSRDGLVWGSGFAERSLDRCRVRVARSGETRSAGELVVDPGTRFRFELQQWSMPPSMHVF
jgi:hypothetical protein